MGLFLTNKKRNYTSMNNVWSTLLGLVAELNINKKSTKEVTDLREESDGDKFGLFFHVNGWKNKWFARLHLGSFRKYGWRWFKAMQFFYSFLVSFADMQTICSGSFSHYVKFWNLMFVRKISNRVVCVNVDFLKVLRFSFPVVGSLSLAFARENIKNLPLALRGLEKIWA